MYLTLNPSVSKASINCIAARLLHWQYKIKLLIITGLGANATATATAAVMA
jgi:hypothetical protein